MGWRGGKLACSELAKAVSALEDSMEMLKIFQKREKTNAKQLHCWVFFLSLLSFKTTLYGVDARRLSNIWLAEMSSLPACCLSAVSIVSFEAQKCLNLMLSNASIFFFFLSPAFFMP